MNLNYIEALERMIELEQEIIRLKESNREMLELLREIEWLEERDEYVDGPIYGCPVCENLNTKGHHESCKLRELLAKEEGEGE